MKKIPLNCEDYGSRNYNVPKREGSAARLILEKYCPRCSVCAIHRKSK